ncbi:hypothetical protein E2C01_011955 [Portunus trituberculatus]|uniref:Uncharacterized protein n=1 Tax=Portunus trituberculatus TaxID=210409 RepID=A0A5B7DCU6_PORTR|nr:hypothetical protein [Portunus trituberculatus]
MGGVELWLLCSNTSGGVEQCQGRRVLFSGWRGSEVTVPPLDWLERAAEALGYEKFTVQSLYGAEISRYTEFTARTLHPEIRPRRPSPRQLAHSPADGVRYS